MRIGDVSTGAAKLRLAVEALQIAWRDVTEQWRDETARQFEENYLLELEPRVKSTLEAMGRLANVLNKAQQECGPDRE